MEVLEDNWFYARAMAVSYLKYLVREETTDTGTTKQLANGTELMTMP